MSRGFLGGKQVIKSIDTRKGSRVCSRQQKRKKFFFLRRQKKNYGGKLSLLLFLDSVAIVDVLTGTCYGVKLVKTRTVQTLCLT